MSFHNWLYKKPVRPSKHQASKKGFIHKHRPAKTPSKLITG